MHRSVTRQSVVPPGAGLIALLAALTALNAMAIDMYLPAFPAVRASFGVSPAAVQNSLSIFLVGLAVGQAFYGPLLDRYGRRMPMLAGAGLFVAGSVMAALSSTFETLMAARLIQAIGAAAGLVAPRAIVTDMVQGKAAARIFTILMQVFMIAPVAAPLIGGALLEHIGWRAIFWLLAMVGTTLFIATAILLPETLPPSRRVRHGMRQVAGGYANLMFRPAFIAYALAGGCIIGSLFAYLSGSAFALMDGYGLDATAYSLVFAGNAVGLILAGQVNGMLLRRHSAQVALRSGLIAHLAAAIAMAVAVLSGHAPLPLFLLLLWFTITGLGMTFGTLTALTMAHVDSDIGLGSALMGILQNIIGAAAGIIIGIMGAVRR